MRPEPSLGPFHTDLHPFPPSHMYFWLKPKVPKVHPKGSGSSEQGGLAWTAALPPQDARDRRAFLARV